MTDEAVLITNNYSDTQTRAWQNEPNINNNERKLYSLMNKLPTVK
jgi:hypothetical protein